MRLLLLLPAFVLGYISIINLFDEVTSEKMNIAYSFLHLIVLFICTASILYIVKSLRYKVIRNKAY